MQKKIGKALLREMVDAIAREQKEEEKARQEREDMENEDSEVRRSREPRKCVSWVELPKQERSDDDAVKVPMRPYVVERFPTVWSLLASTFNNNG